MDQELQNILEEEHKGELIWWWYDVERNVFTVIFSLLFFSMHREIVQYLKHKSVPPMYRVSTVDDLIPFLNQFETGDLQAQGMCTIVLGVFPESAPDSDKVRNVPILCVVNKIT